MSMIVKSMFYYQIKDPKEKEEKYQSTKMTTSPRTFGPLVIPSSTKNKNGDHQNQEGKDDQNRIVIQDMMSYPGPVDYYKAEEEEKQRKHQATNEMLRIDETAELLLFALKRNRQLGLQLTEKQKELLKNIGQYLVFEERDGVRKSKARMDFEELKEWDV